LRLTILPESSTLLPMRVTQCEIFISSLEDNVKSS